MLVPQPAQKQAPSPARSALTTPSAEVKKATLVPPLGRIRIMPRRATLFVRLQSCAPVAPLYMALVPLVPPTKTRLLLAASKYRLGAVRTLPAPPTAAVHWISGAAPTRAPDPAHAPIMATNSA